MELRREQYTLRDSYRPQIIAAGPRSIDPVDRTPSIGAEIEVLPLGLANSNQIGNLVFVPEERLLPNRFTEEELKRISDYYWAKQEYKPASTQFYIDFRELEHVYEIFMLYFDLESAADLEILDTGLQGLMKTLWFYTERAELSEIQREILDLKLAKVKNVDIAN